MKVYFAPLQGYADYLYLYHHSLVYGKVDACYSPFVRIEKGAPRHQDIKRLSAALELGLDITPQVIFNSFEEWKALTDAIKQLGYTRIDMNLGCPYPMQTRRGRGAAVIGNVELMSKIAEAVNADASCEYSVKMRLGLTQPDEWKALMPCLNAMRLQHVTMHPRVATEMYGGEMHAGQFDDFLAASVNRVVWNGDIRSVADIKDLADKYPQMEAVMIGRGLLARPSLAAEWTEGAEWDRDKRMAHIAQLHEALYDSYENLLCGPTQMLQKIKPFWEYLEPEIGHKAAKTIKKATSLPKYQAAVATALQE